MPVNRTGPRGYTRGLWRVQGHVVSHHTSGDLDPVVDSAMHRAMNMPVGTKKRTSLHRFYGVGAPTISGIGANARLSEEPVRPLTASCLACSLLLLYPLTQNDYKISR